jgi:hypothetical protein
MVRCNKGEGVQGVNMGPGMRAVDSDIPVLLTPTVTIHTS